MAEEEWSQALRTLEVRLRCASAKSKLCVEFFPRHVKISARDRREPLFLDFAAGIDWRAKANAWEVRDGWLGLRLAKAEAGLWQGLRPALSRAELRQRREEDVEVVQRARVEEEERNASAAGQLARRAEEERAAGRARRQAELDALKQREKEAALQSVLPPQTEDVGDGGILTRGERERMRAKGEAATAPLRQNQTTFTLNFTPRVVEALAARESQLLAPPQSVAGAPPQFWLRDRADQLFCARDFEGAEAAYRQFIAQTPQNAHAHNGLAATLLRRGDVAGCLSESDRALACGPPARLMLLIEQRRCFCLVAQGELLRAKEALVGAASRLDRAEDRAALETLRGDIARLSERIGAETALEAARAQLRSGEAAVARETLCGVLEACPSLWQARSNLALCLLQQGQLLEALGHLEQLEAVFLGPASLFAGGRVPAPLLDAQQRCLRRQVECLSGLGRVEEAAQAAGRLAALDTADAAAQDLLRRARRAVEAERFTAADAQGREALAAGQAEAALELFTQAERLADAQRRPVELLVLLCNKTAALARLNDHNSVLRESAKGLRLLSGLRGDVVDEQRRQAFERESARADEAECRLRLRKAYALAQLQMPLAAREEAEALLRRFPGAREAEQLLAALSQS